MNQVAELRSFAAGLERDRSVVKAGLEMEWSNGWRQTTAVGSLVTMETEYRDAVIGEFRMGSPRGRLAEHEAVSRWIGEEPSSGGPSNEKGRGICDIPRPVVRLFLHAQRK